MFVFFFILLYRALLMRKVCQLRRETFSISCMWIFMCLGWVKVKVFVSFIALWWVWSMILKNVVGWDGRECRKKFVKVIIFEEFLRSFFYPSKMDSSINSVTWKKREKRWFLSHLFFLLRVTSYLWASYTKCARFFLALWRLIGIICGWAGVL